MDNLEKQETMKPEILITNPEKLQKKIERFQEGGAEKMHVLSDFDRTLTKCLVGGKQSSTSWAQFRNLGYFGEDYIKKSQAMFDYYRPIEISLTISEKEKMEKMKEWWDKHLNLLLEYGVSQQIIKNIVEKSGMRLRDGALDFLRTLEKEKIPLVVMSSGLGDLITEILKKENVLYDNIHIISNFFEFGKDGIALRAKNERIIHSYNKKGVIVDSPTVAKELSERKNVLLLGDTLGDVKMIEKFPCDEIIKVGFLNERIDEQKEEYAKNFDVIIINDSDMNYVSSLIDNVIKKQS